VRDQSGFEHHQPINENLVTEQPSPAGECSCNRTIVAVGDFLHLVNDGSSMIFLSYMPVEHDIINRANGKEFSINHFTQDIAKVG
jgi:hypothetical protein